MWSGHVANAPRRRHADVAIPQLHFAVRATVESLDTRCVLRPSIRPVENADESGGHTSSFDLLRPSSYPEIVDAPDSPRDTAPTKRRRGPRDPKTTSLRSLERQPAGYPGRYRLQAVIDRDCSV